MIGTAHVKEFAHDWDATFEEFAHDWDGTC